MKINIPKELNASFSTKLKILATITDPAIKESNASWGVFYCYEENNHALWLIPFSDKAKKIAGDAIINGVEVPKIKCSEIVIRNNEMNNEAWKEDGLELSEDDPILSLEPNSHVKNLGVGEWKTITYKNEEKEESRTIWVGSNAVKTNERQIIFFAPHCHIVDENGKYLNHEIWFGVRNNTLPFISINTENQQIKDGLDCPILWKKSERIDDILQPKTGGDTYEVETKGFEQTEPVKSYYTNPGDRCSIIINSFGNIPKGELPKSWIIIEKPEEKGRTNLNLIYVQHYYISSKDKSLGSIIGYKDVSLDSKQKVTIVSICRADSTIIFTMLKDFPDRLFNSEKNNWNKKVNKVKNGLENIQSSSPVALVPIINNFPALRGYYITKWKVNANTCNNRNFSFDLVSTVYEKDKKDRVYAGSKINLPLLHSQNSENKIELKNPEFSLSSESSIVNDNGTLACLTLDKYELNNDNIVLQDGSLSFTLSENTANIRDKSFGRFRIILQRSKTQTPFFLWQWHVGIDDIEVSYAVENFLIPINEVKAAGQDRLDGDQFLAPQTLGTVGEGGGEKTEPSLIIPIINKKNKDKKNKYLLNISESVNVGQDYRINMKLEELEPSAGEDNSSSISAVVLDANPQFIGLVKAKFLQQPGFDDGAWVLAVREQEGGWRFLDDKATTEGFQLVLPSQAIGEAYVKNDEKKQSIHKGEPQKDLPIEYRFGAPAILRLAPERLDKRYVTAPWSLRKIWGQSDEVSPGIPLLEAQFELLYGLQGHLKPEKAFLAEIGSKLGEVPVPPLSTMAWQPTEEQQKEFRDEWTKYLSFYRAWKSRLAILEPSVDDNFSDAKFKENLDYKPRIDFEVINFNEFKINKFNKFIDDLELPTILFVTIKDKTEELYLGINSGLVYTDIVTKIEEILTLFEEIPESKEKDIWKKFISKLGRYHKRGANLRHPINPSTVNTEDQTLDPDTFKKTLLDDKIKLAHVNDGLAGGFHYGFESTAIYKEFWRESLSKGSSSAELEAPAFSSMGGWGRQIAKFSQDKTVIKSISTMGRTHFYAVERIGRIGAFWNKAKHVIEYERTVVPTEQFKNQPGHLGRPLVRKVREFIEILEPTRKYPDFNTSQPDAPGAVMGCTFKSKIIPVLSSWGRDVVWGKKKIKESNDLEPAEYEPKLIGWEVPLWKPGANPKVYTKPQIQLELMPPIDSDEEAILVNLSEPENLWFYTDTRGEVGEIKITDDVHKWPAVKNVDYTDLPEPEQYNIKPAVDNSPALMEAPMPDVLDVLPGFERWTFKVDRNEIPAAVSSRYYPESGITGRMRSVSMMRGFVRKELNGSTAHETLALLINGDKSLLANYANGFTSLENKIRRGQVTIGDFKKVINSKIGNNVIETLQKLKKDQEGVNAPQLKYFKDLWEHNEKLFYPTQWLWREFLEGAEGMVNRIMSYYDSEVKKLITQFKSPTIQETELKNAAKNSLNKFEGKIKAFHLGIEFSIDGVYSSILKTIDSPINQLDKSINQFFTHINNELKELNIEEKEEDFKLRIQVISDSISKNTEQIEELSIELCGKLEKVSDNEKWISIVTTLRGIISGEKGIIKEFESKSKSLLSGLKNNIENIKIAREKSYKHSIVLQSELQKNLTLFKEKSHCLVFSFKKVFTKINEDLSKKSGDVYDFLSEGVEHIIEAWDTGRENYIKTVEIILVEGKKNDKEIISVRANILNHLVKEIKQILFLPDKCLENEDTIFCVLSKLDNFFKEFQSIITSNLISVFGAKDGPNYEEWLNKLDTYVRLENAIAKGKIDAILAESNAFANSVNQEFGRLAGEVAQKVKDFDIASGASEELIKTGEQTLNNFRSVWEEFTAPGMGLNRKTIALIVKTDPDEILERLSITPCISRVKEFGNAIDGLGIRLPVVSISDRLLPAIKKAERDLKEMGESLLSNFDFSNIISDIGGMRLDKLFPGFKMPNAARDNIKVTQGFDKQNLMAWINADANVGFTGKKTLMSYGPLQVLLESGSFKAKTRIEVNSEGSTKKNNKGELRGNWHISISGNSLMIFKDAGVIFDNGKFTFDLDPKRMEMPGLLQLLSEATQTIGGASSAGDDSGDEKGNTFNIGLLKQNGIPTGLKAALDIPPISVSAGVAGISNLSFGGFFMLSFLDENYKMRFLTGCGFYIGTRENPFNLTIFFLGGGGYIQYAMYFEPERGFTIRFAMSVHVSASYEIGASWIQGGVTIRLGLEGVYEKYPDRSSSTYFSIFVEVVGQVEIISLISVQLYLMLQATYKGDTLIGSGRVSVKIRVSRFYKIKVKKTYTKKLMGSGKSEEKLLGADYSKKAEEILNSLN